MNAELLPITGAEVIAENQGDTCDCRGCLVYFYKAFNQRDLTLMAKNWS